jgi:inhibitor of KinA sporulation pathway (predicted exonuclease)
MRNRSEKRNLSSMMKPAFPHTIEKPLVVVIDLEATCCDAGSVPQAEMEIIEIGAVVASLTGKVVAEWASQVRPVRHPQLTKFCTSLTGIEQHQVDSADPLPLVLQRFMEWLRCQDKSIAAWASWGAYDLHQWRQDLNHHGLASPLPSEHLNLKALFAKRQHLKKRPALSTALSHASLEFVGKPHWALDDARNAVRLLPYVFGDEADERHQRHSM